MQYALNINLPETFPAVYATDQEKAVLDLLNTQQESLALMIQGYHSREKVRHVNLIADSLDWDGEGKGSLIASYQLEEYNVCSAIDRTETERMRLTFDLPEGADVIKVLGVFIPEREPDSF